jgi:hypothetical protein
MTETAAEYEGTHRRRGRPRIHPEGQPPPDQHTVPSKAVRLPVGDGPSLMAWYGAYWEQAGLGSLNAALVEALREFAARRGWTSPAEAAEAGAAVRGTRDPISRVRAREGGGELITRRGTRMTTTVKPAGS